MERRTLFLSKIDALLSPTAASLPITPPESPAVFHFTLPSGPPGLVSPLALFETLEKDKDKDCPPLVCIEQVDFHANARRDAGLLAKYTGIVGSMKVHRLARVRDTPYARDAHNKSSIGGKSRNGLPSLSDISKRLAGNVTVGRAKSTYGYCPGPTVYEH